MKMRLKSVMRFWILFTLILTFLCIYITYGIVVKDEPEVIEEVQECMVEAEMVGLPSVTVIEREEEVIVEKVVDVYSFPFEMEERGTYRVKGACKCCLPTKEYKKMQGKEGVTVFASANVIPEGSLIWVENVGIYQVQTVYTDYTGIFVFFDSHAEVEAFGERELKVFNILE